MTDKEKTLNHEYGHILQEQDWGTAKYFAVVFVPSATYNLYSRNDYDEVTYYSMPWEYDADVRGGVVNRGAYKDWTSDWYECYWGVLR